MAFWTDILRCADGAYHTGHRDDLARRIGKHRTGGYGDYRSRRRPVTLAWSEACGTREEALMGADGAALSHLARPPHERIATPRDANGDAEHAGLAP